MEGVGSFLKLWTASNHVEVLVFEARVIVQALIDPLAVCFSMKFGGGSIWLNSAR